MQLGESVLASMKELQQPHGAAADMLAQFCGAHRLRLASHFLEKRGSLSQAVACLQELTAQLKRAQDAPEQDLTSPLCMENRLFPFCNIPCCCV